MTRWPSQCPSPVEHPVMIHRWQTLTFLHWPYEPAVVQRLLPSWLTVETYGGKAWVGLVPFVMRVRRRPLPEVPWFTCFYETNVRTYVTGPDGSSGVWFFSLDASRAGVVAVARATYGVPYFWSRMRVRDVGARLEYECRRRYPGPRGARSQVAVTPGAAIDLAELTEFDHYLTARWQLFAPTRGHVIRGRADHGPWPLRTCEVHEVDDELLAAAGLPQPVGEPIAHFSDSITVGLSKPERVTVAY